MNAGAIRPRMASTFLRRGPISHEPTDRPGICRTMSSRRRPMRNRDRVPERQRTDVRPSTARKVPRGALRPSRGGLAMAGYVRVKATHSPKKGAKFEEGQDANLWIAARERTSLGLSRLPTRKKLAWVRRQEMPEEPSWRCYDESSEIW